MKRGSSCTKDGAHSGHPVQVTTKDIFEGFHDNLMDDRPLKVRDLIGTVDISTERAQYHTRKIAVRAINAPKTHSKRYFNTLLGDV